MIGFYQSNIRVRNILAVLEEQAAKPFQFLLPFPVVMCERCDSSGPNDWSYNPNAECCCSEDRREEDKPL
jgi:hypothetical protein